MMPDENLIIDVFSYSDKEQEVFPYIRKYMRKIAPVRDEILATAAGRERYMLAGLFLTYRACNHQGLSMTTVDVDKTRNQHTLRLWTYQHLSGKQILSTDDYLSLIGYSIMKITIWGPHNFLFKFVVDG